MIRQHTAITERFRYAATLAATCLLMATAQAADDLTQPIRVSPGGHFLAQPDGQPFFWLGDTAWALFQRSTREEADRYLEDRAAKGFTVIQAVALGFVGIDTPNRYGERTLLNNDPATPNPRYFDHVDWIVSRAAQYGLRIALLPNWGVPYLRVDAEHPSIMTPANARMYGRWLGARYRDKGVIWVLGGDSTPLWRQD
ncbi:MAG: DUF4038 domain-containing protein [Acidobacteria bacterium]|nr:DUF4038 domain-containing protein [Acidobacteriota bacterium]